MWRGLTYFTVCSIPQQQQYSLTCVLAWILEIRKLWCHWKLCSVIFFPFIQPMWCLVLFWCDWHKNKHKYLSTKLQLTLLPTPRASVSFELLSCWLCLMVYCEEYFCKIFHSFPVTFSWASLLNGYILVIMLLFMLLSTSSSPLIMILQAKCCFELTVPNKFSSENIYPFMQLRSKK